MLQVCLRHLFTFAFFTVTYGSPTFSALTDTAPWDTGDSFFRSTKSSAEYLGKRDVPNELGAITPGSATLQIIPPQNRLTPKPSRDNWFAPVWTLSIPSSDVYGLSVGTDAMFYANSTCPSQTVAGYTWMKGKSANRKITYLEIRKDIDASTPTQWSDSLIPSYKLLLPRAVSLTQRACLWDEASFSRKLQQVGPRGRWNLFMVGASVTAGLLAALRLNVFGHGTAPGPEGAPGDAEQEAAYLGALGIITTEILQNIHGALGIAAGIGAGMIITAYQNQARPLQRVDVFMLTMLRLALTNILDSIEAGLNLIAIRAPAPVNLELMLAGLITGAVSAGAEGLPHGLTGVDIVQATVEKNQSCAAESGVAAMGT